MFHTHVCPLSADRSNETNRYKNPYQHFCTTLSNKEECHIPSSGHSALPVACECCSLESWFLKCENQIWTPAAHTPPCCEQKAIFPSKGVPGGSYNSVVPEASTPSPCVGISPKKALTEPEPLPHDTWRWSEREESLSAFISYFFSPWRFFWGKWKRHSLPVPGSHLVLELPGDWNDLLNLL